MNEELKIIITAEIEQLKKEVDSAKKQMDKFAKQSDKSSKNITKAMKALGKGVGVAMKAVGAAVAAGAAAMVGAAEATREYREDMNKLGASFEAAGMSAQTSSDIYAEMYRNIGESDAAVEAAQQIALLADSEEEAAKWAEYASGVVASFGDALPVETFYEGANETMKLGEATGGFAQMLEQAGLSVEDFNAELLACTTEAEQQALMLEYTEKAVGDAGRAYKEMNADIYAARDAEMAMSNAMAELGSTVEPVITILKTGLADTLATLVPHLQLVTGGLQDIINGVEGGAEKLGEGLSGMLTSLIERIVEIAPQIINTIVAIFPQITGAVLGALPLILQAVIKIIISVIEGIAEMLPTIVNQVVEVIPLLIQTLIDNIPALLDAAITLLMAIVDAIPVIIVSLVDALPDLIDSLLNTLVANIPVVLDAAVELFMALVDAIPMIVPAIVKALPKIINSLIDALISATPKLLQGGVNMFMALVQAIPKVIPELIKGLGTMVKSIKDNLVEKIKGLLKFKWEWPKVKMPSLSVTWSDSPAWLATAAKLVGLDGVPNFKLNWNAMGGVFDKPTVFSYGNSLQGIGESGAEAVVPLENNLGWLDKLATMLSERMGNTPIVLQVDGKAFAQTSISTINNLTRQTGKLGLVVT